MTDRVNALLVVLEANVRDDDIEPLVEAIRQMRNVQSVELNVADADAYIAESRAKIQIISEINLLLQRMMRDV